MNKIRPAGIASLIVLILIAGCTATKTRLETAETPQVQLPPPEPQKPAPAIPEPTKPQPPEPCEPKPLPVVSFHDNCAEILTNYVDEKGMVDYRTLKRKKLQLTQLLDEFDRLDPNQYNAWPRQDKIAFWLNAYNMQMLRVILENYPIQSSRIHRLFWPPDSIRHIKGIWDSYKFIVMDEEFTLYEVEQRFFRQQFDEPRIFLALSQASLSSPPLRNEPYYGCKLNEQLDDQAKTYLSGPHGFRLDRTTNTVFLSAIFDPAWHGKQFISKYGTNKKFKDRQPATRAVLNFICNYISEQDVRFLEIENYSIEYIRYDWRLNDGSQPVKYEF